LKRSRARAVLRIVLTQQWVTNVGCIGAFLDKSDDYVTRELEHEDGNDELPGHDEPSLGGFDRMMDQSKSWRQRGDYLAGSDSEQDDCDKECSDTGIGDEERLRVQRPSTPRVAPELLSSAGPDG
jgi:hypothetical protein